MAYTQDDIDTLKAALATGTRRVKFQSGSDSREVEYQSRADMIAQLEDMIQEVSPSLAAPMVTYIRHCRD
ncbi:MAG: hypothetical protein WA418_39225 [Bradyrhizobium sp.]